MGEEPVVSADSARAGTAAAPGPEASPKRRSKLVSIGLWVLAAVLALTTFLYQDKTGPTYPLEGTVTTSAGDVSFTFLRSETIGTPLKIMLVDPVPEGVTGTVKYRRFKSHDDWSEVEMSRSSFEFSRRGSTTSVEGVGVELPSLPEKAGKYEYFVYVNGPGEEPFSITGEKAVYARYKGDVPMTTLLVHILSIFVAMALALRTSFEALRKEPKLAGLLWATLATLVFGAFVMGPIVQRYAFGVLWSGIPFGYDWTDNKVLVELVAWLVALWGNTGGRRHRWLVLLAGVVTLAVYFIPHSIFGSEYDYTKGAGRGTTG